MIDDYLGNFSVYVLIAVGFSCMVLGIIMIYSDESPQQHSVQGTADIVVEPAVNLTTTINNTGNQTWVCHATTETIICEVKP